MAYVFVKYFHIVAVLVLFASLAGEHLLLKDKLTAYEIRRLSVIDLIYGISAGLILLLGLLLWFVVGKPASFYSPNPVFHIKISLFVLIGLMSVYPTRFFLRSRRSKSDFIEVPKMVLIIIRIELCLLIIIPLLAVLMAQGIGL